MQSTQSYFNSILDSKWIKFSNLKYGFLYKKKSKIDVSNGEVIHIGVEEFIHNIMKTKIFRLKKNEHHVIHLCYEFGNYINDLSVDYDAPLVIHLVYKKRIYLKKNKRSEKLNLNVLLKEEKTPTWNNYKKKIIRIRKDILKGKYYQINYTNKYKFNINASVKKVLGKFLEENKNLSVLSHATLLRKLNLIFLSNTPECLFQIVNNKGMKEIKINSYPMKGTLKRKNDSKQMLEKLKDEFYKSKKNSAELDMISDLIRNDLIKLQISEGVNPDAKILKRKIFVKVPGLLQQMSQVQASISSSSNLGKIITSLFPSGSITGSPKLSAITHLKKLEMGRREFYCGTTIYHSKTQCCASVNIRSISIVDGHSMELSAGGGITLLSSAINEWNEMIGKIRSIMSLLM